MTGRARPAVMGIVATAVVTTAVVLGLRGVGPPSRERSRQIDERRVDDLRRIAETVDLYWTREGRLPTGLSALPDYRDTETGHTDPVTGHLYNYRAGTGSRFELCGHFETAGPPSSGDQIWRHPAGRHCFELDAQEVDRRRDDGRPELGDRAVGRPGR